MSGSTISEEFQRTAQAPAPPKPRRKKRPAPLSIRVSDEEREKLRCEAGGGSVHGYVRDKLFGASASPSRAVRRANTIDHAALGRLSLLFIRFSHNHGANHRDAALI